MNIVYIHQHFRTPEMGGGTRSYEFARRLVKSGHRVRVIAADPLGYRGFNYHSTSEDGVVVHWLGVDYDNAMTYKDRMKAFGAFARQAATRAAESDQDLVFATSTPLTVAIPAIWSKRRRRVPMVFEVRDLWPAAPIAMGALKSPAARFAARRLEGWAYRNAAHVIALSPDMRDDINTRFPRVPTTVIPNGCDTDLFGMADGTAVRRATWWLNPDRPLIVYAGSVGRVNGVGYIVRMAAALQRRGLDHQFAIIGDGVDLPQVQQMANDHRVTGRNLHFLPSMPKAEVAEWFAAASLGISTVIDKPVLSSNSANKVFDTWAAGVPVAINHGGWLADVIRRTGAGLVLPADSPELGALKIVDFLDDGDRTVEARLAAHKLAVGEFSRDELYRRFEQVLVEAAAR